MDIRAQDGHCSNCRRIWQLSELSGKCPLCGTDSHKVVSRSFRQVPVKVRVRRKAKSRRPAETIASLLTGDYAQWYQVACQHEHKAPAEDREDIRHSIILRLAQVAKANGDKPLTVPAQHRVASYVVSEFWRSYYRLNLGLDCGNCSTKQRRKCRADYLYSECPKLITLESLSKPILDTEGNLTELGDTIADDTAIDLDEWVDTDTFLKGCPKRLIQIAVKRVMGKPLDVSDRQYLSRYRRKAQLKLF